MKERKPDRIWHQPGFRVAWPHQRLGVERITKNPGGPGKGKVFQPRGQPIETHDPGAEQLGQLGHVAVNRENVGKSRKYGRKSAVPLGALTVNQIRADFFQKAAGCEDAAEISGAKPSPLGDIMAVKPDILRKLVRG